MKTGARSDSCEKAVNAMKHKRLAGAACVLLLALTGLTACSDDSSSSVPGAQVQPVDSSGSETTSTETTGTAGSVSSSSADTTGTGETGGSAETDTTDSADTSHSTVTQTIVSLEWSTKPVVQQPGSSSEPTTPTTPAEPDTQTPSTEFDSAMLTDCVFVGDSICSGLTAYKILSTDQVIAKGSIGVRSVFDNRYSVKGAQTDIITGLTRLAPKRVIFWMGMNDIHMSTPDQFCENYRNLLQQTADALPDAKLYVCAISPIDAASDFSTNAFIDTYNNAIKQYLESYANWNYIDITPVLKDSNNCLKKGYNSGDGLHLSPTAYQLMLGRVCEELERLDGTPTTPSVSSSTTTESTTTSTSTTSSTSTSTTTTTAQWGNWGY